MKNKVSQINQESTWDGPWTFGTSKNIILNEFQASRTLEKPEKWWTKKIENWPRNLIIWSRLGPKNLNFPMLAHVLPAARPRGMQNMTIRADTAQ